MFYNNGFFLSPSVVGMIYNNIIYICIVDYCCSVASVTNMLFFDIIYCGCIIFCVHAGSDCIISSIFDKLYSLFLFLFPYIYIHQPTAFCYQVLCYFWSSLKFQTYAKECRKMQVHTGSSIFQIWHFKFEVNRSTGVILNCS